LIENSKTENKYRCAVSPSEPCSMKGSQVQKALAETICGTNGF